jgi:hypothetical protein
MYRYNVAISNVVDKEGIYSTSKFTVHKRYAKGLLTTKFFDGVRYVTNSE